MTNLVLTAHQPNLLASAAVIAPSIVAHQVARETGANVMFKAVDYDVAGDQRFRSPVLPSISVKTGGALILGGAVPKRRRKQIASSVEMPDGVVERWRETYEQSLRSWLRSGAGATPPRDMNYLEPIEKRLIIDAGIAQLDADLLDLGIPIEVSKASTLWARSASDLISKLIELGLLADSTDLWLWYVCPTCHQRSPACLTPIEVTSNCRTCDSGDVSESLPFDPRLWVPRVGLCNLFDLLVLRPTSIVLYAGSQIHFESSVSSLKALGLPVPERFYVALDRLLPPPHFSVQERHEDLLSRGRFSCRFMIDASGGNADHIRKTILRACKVERL